MLRHPVSEQGTVRHRRITAPFVFEGPMNGETVMTQRCDESDGFPVPVRHFLDEPLARRRG
jgi:hypothetical protein